MKLKRKAISILLALSLLVSMLVPMTALAYTENRVSTVPTIADDADNASLGYLTLKEDSDYADDMLPNRSFTVTFPSGVKIKNSVSNFVYWSNNSGAYQALGASNVTISGDYTVDITLPAVTTDVDAIQIRPIVDIDGFDGGDIEVTVDSFDSGVTGGKYVLGRVGSGDTTATVIEVKTIGEVGQAGTIRITENSLNAIGEGSQELTLKLPTKFKWDTTNMVQGNVDFLGGFNPGSTITGFDIDGRTLKITFDPANNRTQRGIMQIQTFIKADSDASYGEVEVSISGDEIDDADLVIAKYADFGITIKADGDVEEVLAGQIDEELTKLYFKENVKDSFVAGRKTMIEFPSWIKIVDVAVSDAKYVDGGSSALETAIKGDIDGTDNKVEFVVPANAGGKTEFKLEFTVSIKANASGDIVAKVSGRSGAEGEVTIGTALAPVTVTADSKDVRIGVKNQPIGDIVITEAVKEALMEGDLILELPSDVEWSEVPTVTIEEGNIDIDEDAIDTEDNMLIIPIKSEGTKVSKIKVSGGMIDINRTVAEGAVLVSVKGSALVLNDKAQLGYDGSGSDTTLDEGEFDQSSVVKVDVAKVITPAPVDAKYTTVFTIGSMTYTVDGVENTMDVAPYIKGDRTYLPIRYAAYAAGVADSNIFWNATDSSVVLIKGDRVVKLTIGSNMMYINGIPFTMDVAPEIVDPGRTMLPLRWVAQALGCTVDWDASTQSVTIN